MCRPSSTVEQRNVRPSPAGPWDVSVVLLYVQSSVLKRPSFSLAEVIGRGP
jgi:hypothetical protein